jgi:hypothetical protein
MQSAQSVDVSRDQPVRSTSYPPNTSPISPAKAHHTRPTQGSWGCAIQQQALTYVEISRLILRELLCHRRLSPTRRLDRDFTPAGNAR